LEKHETVLAEIIESNARLPRFKTHNQILDIQLAEIEKKAKTGSVNLFGYRVISTHVVNDLYYLLTNFYSVGKGKSIPP
jgi:hypothetical protein